ncbi:hypothetical protein ASPVEDRAFT_129399 [Aspergillus versicolor CBS 583.65]|uniref:AB hydrolase-1 domain-containing protein n=1 Tax=Aspergillus versicolor CBS 583.65 TaxID=1036611 RepID=A0A1L9PJW9_ASPVE|nr:uncharacterized protein ASPVEDRAFT_129399 [Aspergillus versicolor CBS 583.65]OJJ01773.1 hypothetical protein ASPVEDRAFT_129399 [Aspergillus versicolor CBS 583.65]
MPTYEVQNDLFERYPPGFADADRWALPRRQGKRRLLLIYIHGFLGSEDSFYQFPRRVHDMLAVLLAETHVVYTKIYPRYKTRGPLHDARDGISQWLSPHEASDLDVILLGHSLGGLIAAEVALMVSGTASGQIEGEDLKHNIAGLVAFDAPFLGLHPRVVRTGIGRLFRRKGRTNNEDKEEEDAIRDIIATKDTSFNPAFPNDLNKPRWKGWDGARHFFKKNSRHLSRSALQYVFSYYDHTGCLNEYLGLLKRHKRLCRLAEVNHSPGSSLSGRRVRFINYYTTAYPVKEKGDSDNDKEKRPWTEMSLTCRNTTELHRNVKEHRHSTSIIPGQRMKGKDGNSLHWAVDRVSSLTEVDSISHPASSCDSSSGSRSGGRHFCLVSNEACKKQLWAPIYMEGMDEITAHQSIFLALGSHYEQLVVDIVARIETWLM